MKNTSIPHGKFFQPDPVIADEIHEEIRFFGHMDSDPRQEANRFLEPSLAQFASDLNASERLELAKVYDRWIGMLTASAAALEKGQARLACRLN
jgi:hypothetical protein